MISSSAKPRLLKLLVGLIMVVAGVVAFQFLPLSTWLESALAWIDSLGILAPVAFVIIYAVAVVFLFPASVLTLAAGTGFGVVLGSVYVSIASTLGATLAFLVGRYAARKRIEKRIAGNSMFTAIDAAVAREGWKIVGLTRLSPVFPFALLNYGYGVTKVKLSHYVLASWIGMMPATVLFVYIGSLGKAAAAGTSKSPWQWGMYGVGLLATIAVTVYVTTIARQALNKKMKS